MGVCQYVHDPVKRGRPNGGIPARGSVEIDRLFDIVNRSPITQCGHPVMGAAMTVRELIEELEGYNGDWIIHIDVWMSDGERAVLECLGTREQDGFNAVALDASETNQI